MKADDLQAIKSIEKILQYNVATTIITSPRQVPTQELVNGFVVRNTGNSVVNLDGDLLTAGQSKSIGGNRNEIYVGRIHISFQAANPVVNPRIDQCTITEKFYTNIPRNPNSPVL